MKKSLRYPAMIWALALALLCAAAPSRAQDSSTEPTGYSHVRIVRLSFVDGTVTVQRPGVADWAAAPANTPIQEGFKLSTAENSFAEVEFENTSTARVGQLSLMDFDQLALTPSGGKVNRMTLEDGYATFTVQPDQVDAFEVTAMGAKINLTASTLTRFRVDIDQGAVRVEVFKGAANVRTGGGEQTLTHDMVANIAAGGDQAIEVSRGITEDAWDQWVNQREEQTSVVRNSPNPGAYGAGNYGSYYGWNDLSNYGAWNYFPGYGYGWGPDVAFGWSPYGTGRWCWYPSFGYTWISFEPWGWLPYHYGGWQFMPGFGWAWFPGSFNTWYPGNVTWSQGAGWVAWTPNPPGGGHFSVANGCAAGRNCGRIIVRPNVVQEGRTVGPANRLTSNDASGGRVVVRPDIQPNESAILTGTPIRPATGFTGRTVPTTTIQGEGGAQGTSRVVVGGPGVRSAGPRTVGGANTVRGQANEGAGVEFDSSSGRFVNSNSTRPATTTSPENTAPGSETSPRIAAPFGTRSTAVPVEGETSSPRGVTSSPRVAPGRVSAPSHSEAPVLRPGPSESSGGSRGGFWGGSRSSSNSGGSRGGGGFFGSRSSGSSGGGGSSRGSSGGGGSSRGSSGSGSSGGGGSRGGSSGGGSGSSSGGGHSSGGTHR